MRRPSPRLSSTSRPRAGVGRTGGAWFQDWKLRRRPQLVADGSLVRCAASKEGAHSHDVRGTDRLFHETVGMQVDLTH